MRVARPKAWLQIRAAGTPPEALSLFVEAAEYCGWMELPSGKKEFDSVLGHYPRSAPDVGINADDLAYITYTSGSTGQPKGIVGTHGPLSHFFQWHTQQFGLRESDHFSMLSGLAHDPVLRDIFTPLTLGAALCIPEQEEMLSSTGLFSWMKREEISIAHLTPAMEQILVSRDAGNRQDRLDSLRYAFLAGETLTWQHVESLRTISPAVTCVNFYGATETPQAMGYINVNNICNRKDHGSTGRHRRIPLGQGIEGVQLLVLNATGQRAGIGEIGEIHIRTPYLSKGYLHDDALTQQRFIMNPFIEDFPDRMYKTGDQGRYRPNGDVEFMGRNDRQVKIRGFRVELSEIEAALNEHSQVKHSIASVWEREEGDKQLTAYVVLQEQRSISRADLREHLRQRLPGYMIPGTFTFLDVFPVTPNGKINYRTLPAPDKQQGDHAALVSARNSTEEKLVAIWEELLKKHPIGVKDSFFELGGHSLIAVHMFTRINRDFDVNLPLATLFQESTIEYLANVIDRQTTHEQTWSSLIAVEPEGQHSPFFCVHGLTGDILWFRDLAHCLSPDFPFYGLQSRGLDGIQTPLESIEDMAAHYIKEIRQLQPKGPYYLGGASFGGTVALEMAQQLLVQGEEVSMLASFDHAPPHVCADQEHSQSKRSLMILYRLIKNFPAWLKEFIQLGPSRMLLRVSRKIRFIQKVRNGTENNWVEQLGAEDLIDFAGELAPHRQQLITYNFQALKKYVPKPYAGNVTLFRALNRPLLRTDDPEAGWQKLALGRVKTFDIPSSHEGMFKKPYVEEVAEKLRTCLTEPQ